MQVNIAWRNVQNSRSASSRELHAKDRTGTIVFDPDSSSVRFHGEPAEAQAEPATVTGAAAGLAFDPRVLLEDPLAQLFGNAVPAIANADREPRRCARRVDAD